MSTHSYLVTKLRISEAKPPHLHMTSRDNFTFAGKMAWGPAMIARVFNLLS